MNLRSPLASPARITQSFAEHVEKARREGWCSRPGACASGIYYYGGIDYAVSVGTSVLAAAPGRVIDIQQSATGYGHHVRVQHADGSLTIYAHLSAITVLKNREIQAGAQIGRSGNTGNSTGAHLHFEYRDPQGVPRDPAPLFVSGAAPPPPPAAPPPAPGDKIRVGDLVTLRQQYRLRSTPEINDVNILLELSAAVPAKVLAVNGGVWVQVQITGFIRVDGVEK